MMGALTRELTLGSSDRRLPDGEQAVPAAAVDEGSNDGQADQPNDQGYHHNDPCAELALACCTSLHTLRVMAMKAASKEH